MGLLSLGTRWGQALNSDDKISGGLGVLPHNYYSNATLRTDLDPAALGAHYAAQLRDAGWTVRGEGHEGLVAWSAWTFRDGDGEEWCGLLFALRRPEAGGEYVLYLRADASAGDASSGGWTSSTISATRASG